MPAKLFTVNNGQNLAFDIGYIFKRAYVVNINLALIGMKPIGNIHLFDFACGIKIYINRFGFKNLSCGSIIILLNIFGLLGLRLFVFGFFSRTGGKRKH